ncbi:MAG: DNA-3-methyladenine glycosylase [Micrococcales bacterium]|nr:DNA-3-methyladenine glycosylase [Micrococcales bacterium]
MTTTSDAGQALARAWYSRDVLEVARDLLGRVVTTTTDEGEVTVRLTEVEAYAGTEDPASHGYRGRTARNATMFGEAGRLYVYRHLGLHHCLNVVAQSAGEAAAVLLRAGEVVSGADLAWARREAAGRVTSARDLARGPARLAVCLGLDLGDDGVDVTQPGGRVVLHGPGPGSASVESGPRVGVGGAGADPTRYPWRLWLTGEPTVSAYRHAYRSPASTGVPSGDDDAGTSGPCFR